MPNYQNSKIYAIRSHSQPDKVYIGSTTQTLAQRLGKHRTALKCYQNEKKHSKMTCFDLLETPDHYIELLEEFPCENRHQLNKREGELIRENVCVNKVVPGRTRAEYRVECKDKRKAYYEDNKDIISQKSKSYYEQNRESILKRTNAYKAKNKATIKEKNRIYNGAKIECFCGCIVSRANLKYHQKTIRHLHNYIYS